MSRVDTTLPCLVISTSCDTGNRNCSTTAMSYLGAGALEEETASPSVRAFSAMTESQSDKVPLPLRSSSSSGGSTGPMMAAVDAAISRSRACLPDRARLRWAWDGSAFALPARGKGVAVSVLVVGWSFGSRPRTTNNLAHLPSLATMPLPS